MRQVHNKFSFLEAKNQLSKFAQLEIGHAPTTECDFDLNPGVVGYKNPMGGDVFYCCETHKWLVEKVRPQAK